MDSFCNSLIGHNMRSDSDVNLPSTTSEFISVMKDGIRREVLSAMLGTAVSTVLWSVTLGAFGSSPVGAFGSSPVGASGLSLVGAFGSSPVGASGLSPVGAKLLDYTDMPASKQQLLKYTGSALLHGRPLNSLMVILAGQTGRGKSTTIQRFFDDSIYNSDVDRTMNISVYEKQLRVTSEWPVLVGRIKFIDFPGSLDEEPDRAVENFARLRNFRKNRPELAERSKDAANPELVKLKVEVRKIVYPNLVLLVASANDRDITQPNSDFRKSAAYLKASDTVDTKQVNLIVVITHALDIPSDRFQMRCDAITQDVQSVVQYTFGIPKVQAVFVENKFEGRGEMDGDFLKLPNGERNYENLKSSMEELFRRTHDNIAMQFTSHYFQLNAPEKRIRPDHHSTNIDAYSCTLTAEQKDEARNMLKDLGLYTGRDPTQMPVRFNYLGRGYCPKFERTKQINMFSNCEYKVCRALGQPLRIPSNVMIAKMSELKSERLSLNTKKEYEDHRQSKLGISGNFHLIVGNIGGNWNDDMENGDSQEIVKFSYSFCFANAELERAEDNLDETLTDALDALPNKFEAGSRNRFDMFFDGHGTHLIREVNFGGSIHIEAHLEQSALLRGSKIAIAAGLEGEFKKKFLRVMSEGSWSWGTENSSGIEFSSVKFVGGRPLPDVTTVEELTPRKLKKWLESVKEMEGGLITELPDTMELKAYYLMASTDEKKQALKEATIDYLSRVVQGSERSSESENTREALAAKHAQIARENAEAAAKHGECCFAGSTIVKTLNRGPTPIADLIPGDVIDSGTSATSFLTYLHYDPDACVQFCVIELENGVILELTGEHLLFLAGDGDTTTDLTSVAAREVQPGHRLMAATSPSSIAPTSVTNVSWTEAKTGIYCPLVASGTFLANGVLVSCYSNLRSTSLARAHASLLPLRMWIRLRNGVRRVAGWADATKAPPNGIHAYARALMKFRDIFE